MGNRMRTTHNNQVTWERLMWGDKDTAIGIVAGVIGATVIIGGWSVTHPPAPTARQIRQELLREIEPIVLQNCVLERFGSRADGGYLMCGNLLGSIESAYSYGIAGDDNWGCDVSRRFHVPVHQYDCFDPTRPACPGGRPEFHDECVGPRAEAIESRAYDSVASQIVRNGDAGKSLVVKMDVEGAELDSLLGTPDEQLDKIDQLAIELHAADRRYLNLVRHLKRKFYVVHLHFNNSRCSTQWRPLPSSVYEVLFVNKRIGIPDRSAPTPVLPHPLDAQNTSFRADCQTTIEP